MAQKYSFSVTIQRKINFFCTTFCFLMRIMFTRELVKPFKPHYYQVQ